MIIRCNCQSTVLFLTALCPILEIVSAHNNTLVSFDLAATLCHQQAVYAKTKQLQQPAQEISRDLRQTCKSLSWKQCEPESKRCAPKFLKAGPPPQSPSLPAGRIVGGHDAGEHEFPSIVFVQTIRGMAQYRCGGNILNEMWVVTAAHCVIRYTEVAVLTGVHNLMKPSSSQQQRAVDKVIIHHVHEQYVDNVKSPKSNDVALLKLKTALKFNQYISRSLLTSRKVNTYHRVPVTVAGWGVVSQTAIVYPKVLQTGIMPIMADEECQTHQSTIQLYFLCVHQDPLGTGIGTCVDDSGGSFYIKNANKDNVLVGILVSGEKVCGLPKGASISIELSYYKDWVKG